MSRLNSWSPPSLPSLQRGAGANYENAPSQMFDRDLEYAETVVRKKDARRNFAKFIGKHLCQCFFFNKVARLRPARPWYRCFPVNFAKFLRTPFYIEHLWWLILCTPLDLLVFTHKPIKPILFYKIHRPESIGVV